MNLDYTEFYITNVCNLNCPNCNRFNNFAFSGHSRWDDYKSYYEKWAKILKINTIGILGGEPMLNPDFMSWLRGICELWPDSQIKIITNGTQLNKFPDFYDYVSKNSSQIKIIVSYHGFAQKEKVLPDINNWLHGSIKTQLIRDETATQLWQQVWNNIKGPDWPDCATPLDFAHLPDWIQQECRNIHQINLDVWKNEVHLTMLEDTNGVKIITSMANSFVPSAVKFDPNSKKMTLHNSDPQKAIDVCFSKKCHHFIRGKLYKCGPVGILPEFVKQFSVEMSDDDNQLVNSYVPAEADWNLQQLESFVDDLNNTKTISQCKFCPEVMNTRKFEAGTKKIKLVKID